MPESDSWPSCSRTVEPASRRNNPFLALQFRKVSQLLAQRSAASTTAFAFKTDDLFDYDAVQRTTRLNRKKRSFFSCARR
jgi:hypothetical protein